MDGSDPGTGDALGWLSARECGTPAETLARIRAMCERLPDLYAALMAVQSTHLALPRDIMAAAIKQFRRDTDNLTRDDVAGLLAAGWNGGRQGFDAVLRTRRDGAGRPKGALPAWLNRD